MKNIVAAAIVGICIIAGAVIVSARPASDPAPVPVKVTVQAPHVQDPNCPPGYVSDTGPWGLNRGCAQLGPPQ